MDRRKFIEKRKELESLLVKVREKLETKNSHQLREIEQAVLTARRYIDLKLAGHKVTLQGSMLVIENPKPSSRTVRKGLN